MQAVIINNRFYIAADKAGQTYNDYHQIKDIESAEKAVSFLKIFRPV
jgi:hypothetical protein